MFDNLIGNEKISEFFRRSIKSGKLPNSLLFSGERGVGKFKFAVEAAKAYLCLAPVDFQACGKCSNCNRASVFNYPKSDNKDAHKEVVFSNHPDLGILIPYNRNILVDAVRDLEKHANFRPFEAKARFLIIDDADKMNAQASNALLKTLEEPPENSFIFLITSRIDSLLQTIRSRCQIVRFSPIDELEIVKFLVERREFSQKDARLVAKLANGSIGRALETDLAAFLENRDLMLRAVRALIESNDRADLLRLASSLGDPKFKDDFEPRLESLQIILRDIWSLKHGVRTDKIINSDISDNLLKFSEKAESKNLAEWMLQIEELREQLKFNLNKKIASDALFMQMAGS